MLHGAGEAIKPSPEFASLIEKLAINLDAGLLDLALTHRSYAFEHGQGPTNERLEFLGDGVLEVIITSYLYREFPDWHEGRLSKLRASVVSAATLSEVARYLELGSMVKLGNGEASTGGDDKTSILADTMEAVIGAIYLSDGLPAAEKWVHYLLDGRIAYAAQLGAGLDWKTSLQEVAAALGIANVKYEFTESGPDHDKRFDVWVQVGERSFGPGHGHNKKQAEMRAAEMAFMVLNAELRHAGGATHADA